LLLASPKRWRNGRRAPRVVAGHVLDAARIARIKRG